MIIVLKGDISSQDKSSLTRFLEGHGLKVREIVGEEDTVIGAIGSVRLDIREVEILPGVDRVIPISKPYKMASREFHAEDTVIDLGPVKVGGTRLAVIAGPCAVESRSQIRESAWQVKESGAVLLRGGAFKPRTSPYAFQGLGFEGLTYLREAGDETGMPVVSEVVSTGDVTRMAEIVDVFQIGTRNMQNFELLKAVGATGKPTILKRGMAATIEDWLMAAEYLLSSGTDDVILCERGIRTYERYTRNTLALSAIPVVRKLSHLPVIVDPSHGTGIRDHVQPMALASVAAGAHGLIIEVHPDPDKAASDGPQSLYPAQFEKLMRDIEALSPTVGKEMARLPEKHQKDVLESHMAGAKAGEKPRVAFQGERGAYSEQAILHYFPEGDVDPTAVPRFRDIFTAVLKNEAAWGMVPLENSLAGSVHENYDLLFLHPDVRIVGEIKVRITHNLLTVPGAAESDLQRVYSHPQALGQCAEFLDDRGWEKVPYYDTAGAAAFVAEEKDPAVGAIASAEAGRFYGLNVIREGIETNPRNYTRFAVIARENTPVPEGANKASMVLALPDEAGSLSSFLAIFSDHGINMTKIESRPIPGKPWSYLFYLDVELPENPADFTKAEVEMKNAAQEYRNLGIYRS